ncbi:MAG: hypothetical protein JXR26_09040 [Balneolaceae bacterium]|nr:hypothetical protein [Balneolaceae bacterium]
MYPSVYTSLMFSFLAAILSSCTTGTECCTIPVNRKIDLSFISKNGEDLLNPDHPEAINLQNITVYYLRDGEKIQVPNANHPNVVSILSPSETTLSRYYLRLFANAIEEQIQAKTLIRFSDGSVDTLNVEYFDEDDLTAPAKVWYNQQLRWTKEANEPPFITITKDIND